MFQYLCELLTLIFGDVPNKFYFDTEAPEQYYTKLITEIMILYSLGFRLTVPMFRTAAAPAPDDGDNHGSVVQILPPSFSTLRSKKMDKPKEYTASRMSMEEYLIFAELETTRIAAAVPVLPWPHDIKPLKKGDNTYKAKLQRVFFTEFSLYKLVGVPGVEDCLEHIYKQAREQKRQREAKKKEEKEEEEEEKEKAKALQLQKKAEKEKEKVKALQPQPQKDKDKDKPQKNKGKKTKISEREVEGLGQRAKKQKSH
jgi:hypothetical protein